MLTAIVGIIILAGDGACIGVKKLVLGAVHLVHHQRTKSVPVSGKPIPLIQVRPK